MNPKLPLRLWPPRSRKQCGVLPRCRIMYLTIRNFSKALLWRRLNKLPLRICLRFCRREFIVSAPALAEGKRFRGTWIMMPRGRRKRFKKFTRRIPTKLTPHKVAAIETFGATPLEEFLEEELGVEPGEEVDAMVHLYESYSGDTGIRHCEA